MKRALFLLLVCILPVMLSACAPKSPDVLRVNLDNAKLRKEVLQKYRHDSAVRQVLFISHTSDWDAKARLYVKNAAKNAWSLALETDAVIGKNGMGKMREGDGKTPCGEYGIVSAFGILPNPGTGLPYTNITPTTYACNEDGEYYNQITDVEKTGHACKGEAMFAYSPEYNYGLVTSFNDSKTPNAGSAIFVHCKGMNPFTGGCIALGEADVRTVMRAAHKGMRIYLDEYYTTSPR